VAHRCVAVALSFVCGWAGNAGCDRVKEPDARNTAIDAGSDAGAAAADAGAQPSLCTPERDPLGSLCVPGRIGSSSAFDLARARLPHAHVIGVQSDATGALGPDGLDMQWSFTFEDESTGELIAAGVSGTDVSIDRHPEAEPCGAAAKIHVLDSERIVPSAVLEVEEHVGIFTGNLFLLQNGCDAAHPETHTVALSYTGADGATPAWYFARYWDDGRFIELVGPCVTSVFEECLKGAP
jgi:hypothetical protein